MEIIGRNDDHPDIEPVRTILEQSWSIDDQLKNENADNLFNWIGKCIAEVVEKGHGQFDLPPEKTLSLGVSFSFPMYQDSISQATIMGMGKGFAISGEMEIGPRLQEGYNKFRGTLPPLEVTAIANDAVSTLISFIFKYKESATRKASMGLILGTGCNATIPLKLSMLHPKKRPSNISVLPGEDLDNVKIAINTEWSINGVAPAFNKTGLINKWDRELDDKTELPGFQPLEYMTAGRYLGELARLVFVDYLTNVLHLTEDVLPSKLLQRQSMTTPFLSTFKPLDPPVLLSKLQGEIPGEVWTEKHAAALYHIAKAVECRAAGIVSAAIVGLLSTADEIPQKQSHEVRELGVGYTGGCLVHFQDYLVDCQDLLDKLMEKRFGKDSPVKVVLSPCHDGGVSGAGILAAAAAASSRRASIVEL